MQLNIHLYMYKMTTFSIKPSIRPAKCVVDTIFCRAVEMCIGDIFLSLILVNICYLYICKYRI